MTRSPGSFSRTVRTLFLVFQALFGISGLASCGGGPNVATSTGTVLYVGTGSGIYAFSLMSNNALKPVSTSPIYSGNVDSLQYVQTPNGSSTPMLYVATGTSTITAFSVTGAGSLSSPGTLTTTGSCLTNYTGLSATSDGNWLLAVDGSASSSNIAAINLKNGACTTGSISGDPISVAVDCLVGFSTCNILISLSTTSITTSTSPTNPQFISNWTPGSAFPSTTTMTALTSVWGTAFSPATTYFYMSSQTSGSPGLIGSLIGNPPPSSTSNYNSTNSSFPNTITSPCVDQKNNQLYIPTTNGSIYQTSVNTGGGFGSPTQIWNPTASASLVPQTPNMYACTIQN
ncbi:MAG: hypothetical protein ACYCTV_08705 [Leptospirales bacterium]